MNLKHRRTRWRRASFARHYNYTQNARLLPLRSKDMNGATAILDDSYAYDANTNVVSISDGTAGSSNNRSMSYDAADRLVQTNAPNQAWLANTLSYDALDNIRSNSLGNRTYLYQYDATSKRLSQLTLPNASVARSIGFDAQGNMSSNGSQSYVFDKANRLQSVNGIESYQYDGHGRRVKITRSSDGKISYPIYSLTGQLLSEDDARSNKSTDYIYLNGSLLAKRSAPISSTTYTTSYLHTDALGSPIAESNAAKAIIRTERYTPYGEPSDQGYDQGLGFTGHSTDAATGLTYAQQRYYDPICGCFLSPDPVQTDPNTGASFNRYNYANNNPFRFTDPDGRSWVTLGIKFIAKGGDIAATTAGIVEDFNTLTDSNASFGDRAIAGISILSEAGPVSLRDGKVVVKAVEGVVDASKKFSKEKQALVKMAKADKKSGISEGDMKAYKELNKKLPDPFPKDKVRGPEAHESGAPHSQEPHGHVGPVDHIPIKIDEPKI